MKKDYDIWKGITALNKHTIKEYLNYRKENVKKADSTIIAEGLTLRKLAKFIKNKKLEELTDEDLQSYFKIIKNRNTADLDASHIVVFYQKLFKLPKGKRPPNMYWYEYQKQKDKDRNSKPNKKDEHFIEREEYDLLIQKSISPQNKALWEILYLSGARDGEILDMTNKSVIISEKGYEIVLNSSKTKPRKVPLLEIPGQLLYWIRHHPLKQEEEFPLWISQSNRSFGKPITRSSAIVQRLTADLKRAEINKPLTPHDFRRTRATIMFGEGKTDKEMSLFFGWRLRSVPMRREEYDLTDYNDLKEKIFAKSQNPTSYENLEAENERIKQKYEQKDQERLKEINDFREDVAKQKDDFADLRNDINELKKEMSLANQALTIATIEKLGIDIKDVVEFDGTISYNRDNVEVKFDKITTIEKKKKRLPTKNKKRYKCNRQIKETD